MFIPPHIYGCYSPKLGALPPLCLVNTCPSSHMNLLLDNKVRPTPSAKGSPPGDFTFSPLCGSCGHMTVLTHRTGWDTSNWHPACLPEIAGLGHTRIASSMGWSSDEPTTYHHPHARDSAPGQSLPPFHARDLLRSLGKTMEPFLRTSSLMHRIITNYIEIQLLRY